MVSTMKRKRLVVALFLSAVMVATLVCGTGQSYAASKKVIRTSGQVVYLKAGTSVSLPVIIYDGAKAVSQKLTWKSSNAKIAAVSSAGKVAAKKVGKATITATSKDASALKFTIRVVKAAKKIKSVAIKGASSSVTVGETFRITAKASPANATNLVRSFSSSNKAVLAVDKTGTVKALKVGKAVIKATANGKSASKTIEVKPLTTGTNPPPNPNPTPDPDPTPNPDPVPNPVDVTKGVAISGGQVQLPAKEVTYVVNYLYVTLPSGSTGFSFALGGAAVQATPVLADGTLVKIAAPAGATQATLTVKYDGKDVLTKSVTFASAGAKVPKAIYGNVPMKFSEFFHDVTAQSALPEGTVFAKGGTVAEPRLFITQGTRTGNLVNGTDTMTYAEAEEAGLPCVDAVSTATYGDDVHFVPNANLTLRGNRIKNNDPNKAILGITGAEVNVPFDLFANATLLKKAGKETAQSKNVLAKLTSARFDLINIAVEGGNLDRTGASAATLDVYKAKTMLVDGNFGPRETVNAASVKSLPGDGNDSEPEAVSYGGNWGDKFVGFSFGDSTALGTNYSAEKYWDNFANYIYGGVITDSNGHSEPLVFLQNLFTHRFHEDFDVALSPSRFSRLNALKSPDTYKVTVFADGFEDVVFEYSVKNYSNAAASLTTVDGATTITAPAGIVSAGTTIEIAGLESSKSYATGAKLYKGTTMVAADGYALTERGKGLAALTLKPAFFTGSWQGSYTLQYETNLNVSKPLSFTVINPVEIKLRLSADGADETSGYVEASPLQVTKAQGEVFLNGNVDFAKTLVTAGRGGFSTIQKISNGIDSAVAVGTAIKRDSASDPWRIDLTSSLFEEGETYKLTFVAPGFNNQVFYIEITP